jgi:hypothetical protein
MRHKKADTGFPMAWSLLTEAATSARLEANTVRQMVSRLCAVAEASPDKEEVYAGMGDILVNLPQTITTLETTLDALSYTLASLGRKQLRDRLPIDAKFKVDRALADARLPMVADPSNEILPPKTAALRVARRFVQRRFADLNPPLGVPGGPCQVIRRIKDEVDNPRLQEQLVSEYESGGDLSNAEASQVYEIEEGAAPTGIESPIKKVLISAHAQYRMDLRRITVRTVQTALFEFSKELAQGLKNRTGQAYGWEEALRMGSKIVYKGKAITVVFAKSRMGGPGTVDLITTYPNGGSDPKPVPEGACGIR